MSHTDTPVYPIPICECGRIVQTGEHDILIDGPWAITGMKTGTPWPGHVRCVHCGDEIGTGMEAHGNFWRFSYRQKDQA
jgi:hypothetical protein